MIEELEYRELKAGSIIKINGVPLVLRGPTEVGTHPANWPEVERKHETEVENCVAGEGE